MGIVWYNSFTFTFNVFNPCRKKYKKGFLIKNWTDTRGFSTKPFRKALPHKRIFVFSKFLLPSLRLLDINFKLFHGVSTESCPAEWLNPFQPFHSICLGVFGVRQFLFRGSVRPAKGNGHTPARNHLVRWASQQQEWRPKDLDSPPPIWSLERPPIRKANVLSL